MTKPGIWTHVHRGILRNSTTLLATNARLLNVRCLDVLGFDAMIKEASEYFGEGRFSVIINLCIWTICYSSLSLYGKCVSILYYNFFIILILNFQNTVMVNSSSKVQKETISLRLGYLQSYYKLRFWSFLCWLTYLTL